MSMKIVNFTLRAATPEQLAEGVIEVSDEDRLRIHELFKFQYVPDAYEVTVRARLLAQLAESYDAGYVLVDGPPFLMVALDIALRALNVYPLYALSKKEITKTIRPDGTVVEQSVTKPVGWVDMHPGKTWHRNREYETAPLVRDEIRRLEREEIRMNSHLRDAVIGARWDQNRKHFFQQRKST